MTELDFLLTILLEHKLQNSTKLAIKDRIKEIQVYTQPVQMPRGPFVPKNPTAQAPSILAKYPDLANDITHCEPVPLEAIAQNPETAKALADRQTLIAQAFSGKPEPGRTSPRKIGRQ